MYTDEMNTNSPKISNNILLSHLSADEQEKIASDLRIVTLPLGEIICQTGEKLDYVYFPISGIISLLYVLENGGCAEIAVVGNEGFIGVPILLSGETMPYEIVVQVESEALRMPVQKFTKLLNQSFSFKNILLNYVQALMNQISQTAVCNRHHTIDQQLCRWLLLSLDRLPNNEVCMTQELISHMLGVRREGVTAAASKLQKENLIEYKRGVIQVLDRSKLEKMCCECYEAVSKEYSRIFPRISEEKIYSRTK
jgi:CRP-like cAMP-binding protein